MIRLQASGSAILVLNPGSSSIKWSVYSSATLENAGGTTPVPVATGQSTTRSETSAISQLKRVFVSHDIRAVVIRMVHGGPDYRDALRITDDNIRHLKGLADLAPLHNAVAIDLIEQLQRAFASVRIFVVFDTEFFVGLPSVAQPYGLPAALIEIHRIRRYGFHGFAHESMVEQ